MDLIRDPSFLRIPSASAGFTEKTKQRPYTIRTAQERFQSLLAVSGVLQRTHQPRTHTDAGGIIADSIANHCRCDRGDFVRPEIHIGEDVATDLRRSPAVGDGAIIRRIPRGHKNQLKVTIPTRLIDCSVAEAATSDGNASEAELIPLATGRVPNKPTWSFVCRGPYFPRALFAGRRISTSSEPLSINHSCLGRTDAVVISAVRLFKTSVEPKWLRR